MDLRNCAVFISALSLFPASVGADIYTYTDKLGVIHFSNIKPDADGSGHPWRRIMRTGPGKAAALHARRRKGQSIDRHRYHVYDQHIKEAASLYQIPEALVRAVIHIESDFDHQAISTAGALGLMQLMPFTAQEMGVGEVFDARENIFGGTRYLRVLANRYAGNLTLILAAYHAGPGAVDRYGGTPPYETTQRYVQMVLTDYRRTRQQISTT